MNDFRGHLARLRAARAFLLDMDGTLTVDDSLLPGAREITSYLHARGLPFLYLTNNSSRRGDDFRARLQGLGIPARREQILTSGDATIDHILTTTPHRSAFLVGTPALQEDFRAAGIELDREDPDCVVLGFDTTLTYDKVERACRLLFAGKPYFATHPDRTCFTKRGLVPDIAAVIAACEAVTGRRPKIIGKPNREMVAAALHRLGATADTTAMIGDQLDTDMSMARASRLCGVLVLSGETTPAKLDAWPAAQRPQLVAQDVAEVLTWLDA